MRSLLLVAGLVCGLGLRAAAQPAPRVEYHLGLDGRAAHQLAVELVVRDAPSPLPLAMPVWTLGAYELRTWGKNVTLLGASDGKGNVLKARRTGPSTFVIEGHPPGAEVHLRYRVYATTLSDDGSYVDVRHAYLNGTSVLLYSPPLSIQPHALSITAPPGWQTATALDSMGGRLVAASYEAIVDAPIEVGHFATAELGAFGHKLELVVHGLATVPSRLLTDVAAILEAEVAMLGVPPWRRYVLIIHLEDGLSRVGALEHAASSSVLVPRRSLIGEPWTGDADSVDAYQDLLYVVAHELFHAWNARLLRPAELVPWDPLVPRPARSLWITEGLTEFFAHRAMLLSGLWSRDRWRERVCEEATRAVMAARRGLSLEEDAELAWASPAEAATDPDGYYARGHLVALALDAALRDSGGLTAVLRRLVADAVRLGRPLPVDTERLAGALANPSAAALLRRLASGHDELTEVRAQLLPLGLALRVDEHGAQPFLGVGVELVAALPGQPASLRVVHIVPGSAAQLGGLRPADRILAVDGVAVSKATLPTLEAAPAGRELNLTVRRDHHRLLLTVIPEPLALPRCRLDETPSPTPYLPRR